MKKEELIKKIEERIEVLKSCERIFARIGDERHADIYFWQRFDLQYILDLVKTLED